MRDPGIMRQFQFRWRTERRMKSIVLWASMFLVVATAAAQVSPPEDGKRQDWRCDAHHQVLRAFGARGGRFSAPADE